MRNWILLVFMVAAGAGAYFWHRAGTRELEPAAVPEATQSPQAIASAVSPRYPVSKAIRDEEEPDEKSAPKAAPRSVPALDDSDTALQEALSGIFGRARTLKLIVSKDIIRRIVVTVENATGKRISSTLLPFVPPQGKFLVSGQQTLAIDPANYSRYMPYVEMAQAMNLNKFVSTYVRLYPLFQSAYSDLGRQGYFNDRVVEVLNQLLVTPEVKGPIPVVQAAVMSRYADPSLESLSVSQKALIRMGPENATRLKAVFKKLRNKLRQLNDLGAAQN